MLILIFKIFVQSVIKGVWVALVQELSSVNNAHSYKIKDSANLLRRQQDSIYTIGDKCQSVCGHGIIYIERQECDDGNLNDDDGCNSLCLIVPIRVKTTLTIDMNQNLFTNIRTAIITFDMNYTQDFSLWQITIPGLNNHLYTIDYTFGDNQLNIMITLNTSLSNKTLLIVPNKNTLVKSQIQGLIEFILFQKWRKKISWLFSIIRQQSLVRHSNRERKEEKFSFLFVFVNCEIISHRVYIIRKINIFLNYKHSRYYPRPEYQQVTSSQQNTTTLILGANSIMVNLVAIILGFCLLTGGFNMIWNLLDLFQILSYLKYCNVQFPYNAQTYFDYIGNFNIQGITQYIPFVYEFSSNLLGDYIQSNDTNAPKKMQDDGFSTLFLFNFICIITAWMTSLSVYIGCTIALKITQNFNNFDNLESYDGWRKKIHLCSLRLNRSLIGILKPFSVRFVYSGIIRILISTNYDMNFAVFLELSNFHFKIEKPILTLSSLICISTFSILICTLIKLYTIIKQHTEKQLAQDVLVKKIGSMTEGLQKNLSLFLKYFNLILLIKKILVMFALVCLYDNPLYQIKVISFLHLNMLLMYIFNKPLQETEEYIKCLSSEALVFLVVQIIHIYSFDQELLFLNYEIKSLLGWVIMGLVPQQQQSIQ